MPITSGQGRSLEGDDGTVAGRIAADLARRIITGRLAPDAPLRQDLIAAQFGASHVPVREAFRRLEGQGLLVSEPRRGVRVAPLDAAVITEVTEMRAVLERLALIHALPRLHPANVAAAERAIRAGEAGDDIEAWQVANTRFHRALLVQCNMPRLLSTISDLQRVAARFLHATWARLDWQSRSQDEHRAILALVQAGDAKAAGDALANHIRAAGAALAQSLPAPAAGAPTTSRP
jgi:DNA-binding GntR family transcriptional regulator